MGKLNTGWLGITMSSTANETEYVVLDLDDFYQSNNRLELLFQINSTIPVFRVNLFTVPGRCSWHFIEEVRKISWINMIPHGFNHITNRECEHWPYPDSVNYLVALEEEGWTRGFKAPGWQISDGMYQALLERDWWVADTEYNNHRRPKELRCYLLHQLGRHSIHGHVGHLNGHNKNELEFLRPEIQKNGDKEFKFIKDIV